MHLMSVRKPRIQDSEFWIPFIRHSSLVTRHSSLVTRHSSLVTRHSSLVTRHSSLVTRHSSLVTRHSSLVTHARAHGREASRYWRGPAPHAAATAVDTRPHHEVHARRSRLSQQI